jgi:transcriptional regulator with XRE-family HTH domain
MALGLDDSEAAVRLGVSEVRQWVKASRAEKHPPTSPLPSTGAAFGSVSRGSRWPSRHSTSSRTRARRPSCSTGSTASLARRRAPDAASRTRPSGTPSCVRSSPPPSGAVVAPRVCPRPGSVACVVRRRYPPRAHPRIPGCHAAEQRDVVLRLRAGVATRPRPLHPPRSVPGGSLALSVALSADPSDDAARHLALHRPSAGHLRIPSKYIPQRSCPLSRRSYDPIVPPGRSMRVGSASVVRTPNRRLRGLRERRCESRAEFAGALRRQAAAMGENMAIGERQVARWERGEVRWPRAAYRRVLSALLGVEVDALGFEPPREVAEAISQAPRSQLPMRRLVGAPTTPVAPRLRESAGRGRSGFTRVSPNKEAAFRA